jgi:hypothetical protein
MDPMKVVLAQHFPEYISASCLCGQSIPTYDLWIEHVYPLLKEAAAQEISA